MSGMTLKLRTVPGVNPDRGKGGPAYKFLLDHVDYQGNDCVTWRWHARDGGDEKWLKQNHWSGE